MRTCQSLPHPVLLNHRYTASRPAQDCFADFSGAGAHPGKPVLITGFFLLNVFAQIECNPLLESRNNANHFCLPKLSSPVNFSDHISPICLAPANSTFRNRTEVWFMAQTLCADGELTVLCSLFQSFLCCYVKPHQTLFLSYVQIKSVNECQKRLDQTISTHLICEGSYSLPQNTCSVSINNIVIIIIIVFIVVVQDYIL